MDTIDPSDASHPCLAGLRRGALCYQQCEACTAVQTLTRLACARCGSARLAWKESKGVGTVYAVTLVHRAPSDEFKALAPYTLVLVDLDEGCRVMAHAARGLRIGQRVQASFAERGGQVHAMFLPPA